MLKRKEKLIVNQNLVLGFNVINVILGLWLILIILRIFLYMMIVIQIILTIFVLIAENKNHKEKVEEDLLEMVEINWVIIV